MRLQVTDGIGLDLKRRQDVVSAGLACLFRFRVPCGSLPACERPFVFKPSRRLSRPEPALFLVMLCFRYRLIRLLWFWPNGSSGESQRLVP